MNQSIISGLEGSQETHPIELIPSQTYRTEAGNEYIVTYIARESGNTEDLFVVYKKQSEDGENTPKQNWVKNTKEFESVENFDEENQPETETLEEDLTGQKFQHFKTKDFYIVKAIARNRANPTEMFVIYEGQYSSPEFGENPIWIREYSDFTGMKVFDDDSGRPSVKRFEQIT